MSSSRPRIVIIGAGWAGYVLSQELDDKNFDITVIAPHQTFAYTPLLASAATGLFFARLAEEPIRHAHRHTRYYRAFATAADFNQKTITCIPSILQPGGRDYPDPDHPFTVPYDTLIIAPGCVNQTFNTPGAAEHCFFLKTVPDAEAIKWKLLSLLEIASLPTTSRERAKELLAIHVVGGGPTGVELSAELTDLFGEVSETYPHLAGLPSITIHDVAPEVLGMFHEKLKGHALQSFQKRGVEIKTNSHIEKIEDGALYTKEDGRIPCGMVAWATGNKQCDFVESLPGLLKTKLGRILTDQSLRVLKSDQTVLQDVYALGDVADIFDKGLPTTAEVAVQKAEYLVNALNHPGKPAPFVYTQRRMVAYVGGLDGVIMGKRDWTGEAAWLAWRSGSLGWTRSWRRKAMIMASWTWNYIGGREIARK
ncbi:FAD/NAD(P)-binding domain-containing protein [Gymnopus androsaceus JB14]|uniref:FAD/NAD(P)-binding domain-containing protein n=1 Tax=Gymnopus androsaceus JB14 TaxID=1447944 RepID=A0A6A4HN11_9AGAR|nr:FAD/NAD(P)-binding domain-containing protein [Gymnopus androsaceus JB14]